MNESGADKKILGIILLAYMTEKRRRSHESSYFIRVSLVYALSRIFLHVSVFEQISQVGQFVKRAHLINKITATSIH